MSDPRCRTARHLRTDQAFPVAVRDVMAKEISLEPVKGVGRVSSATASRRSPVRASRE
ncbi:hypothetical protein [Nonomuraea africana]|uniref:Uncharacterized protein n=1 Tax=Nonomuraea africana TaxID=46171 RepID=A0ABR9KAW5_9ACTN|nr:hypothetical protein [Nonomuraea africana]MBE1559154.1 hypothetical protein [Nonomuraea africana]